MNVDTNLVRELVACALAEDFDGGVDITAEATVGAEAWCVADYRARQSGVVAGLAVLTAIFDMCLPVTAGWEFVATDGQSIAPGDVVATVAGPTRVVLGFERTSLNFLSHLSGVATLTRLWVDAIAGSGATIRDTRKTTPGLRFLEKYAVRCGGGANHRFGLFDAVLIKDNHVQAAGGVSAALHSAQRRCEGTDTAIQIEVDTLEQLREALDAGATQILLDNMPVSDMAVAVAVARQRPERVWLEASGGLTLANAAAVASIGVDFLAVGALTHSAPVLDIGLDFR